MTPMISSTILRTQSDARLVELAAGGHERAFEAIVERYRKPLMRYCSRYLPEGRAEDAVQQSFIKAWTAIQEGKAVANLRSWLYKIAHNSALDAAKRSGYDYAELSEALTLGDAPDAELERRRVMRETLTGVAALPENQREALLRTAVEGESRADIARQMGVSEGAVRQLVHRARATLRAGATALTPFPVAGWAAQLGPGGTPAPRIAELVGTVGASGGGAVILKASAAAVIAGTIAVGATGVSPITAQGDETSAGLDTQGARTDVRPGRHSDGIRTAAAIGSLRGGVGEAGANRRGTPGTSPRAANSGPGSTSFGSGTDSSGSNAGTGTQSSGSGDDSSGSGSGSNDSSGSGSGSDDSSGSGSGDISGSDDSSGSGSGDISGSGSGDISGSGSGDISGSGSGSSGSRSGDVSTLGSVSDDVSTLGSSVSGSGNGDNGHSGGD